MECSWIWREIPLLAPITLKKITEIQLVKESYERNEENESESEREEESLLNEKFMEVGERVRHFRISLFLDSQFSSSPLCL